MVTDLLSLTCVHADQEAADQKPVKVYLLSGQSNMVGIGQVNPAGMTRYDTYVTAQTKNDERGRAVSIYHGALDLDTDYDKLKPVETQTVKVGYWPHGSFPKIEGEQTYIARRHQDR